KTDLAPKPGPYLEDAGVSLENLSPDVVARLRAGDDETARAVFESFTPRLIGLARGRLHARLRQRVDPEDVVQSAYKSFLILLGGGGFAAESWESLWGLLTLITLRKCADRARYHRAGCRDASREAVPTEGVPELWREAAGREPTPEEGAVLAETVEQLMREL